MKNLNFLRNLFGPAAGLQSNDVSVDRHSTVVRPSFDRRSSLLKLVSVLVLILTIGVGQMWGTDDTYDFNANGITRISGPASGAVTASSENVVFTSKTGNTTDSWTIAFTANTFYGYGKNNGVNFGANSKSNKYPPHATLTSKSYSNVTAVVVAYSGANTSVTIAVSVGGTSFGSTTTSSGTSHTFSHAATTGAVSISLESSTNGQIKINAVTITYSSGSTYTVSYAAGTGGSGTNPGAHTGVSSGSSITLKANTFTAPTGKQFAGWNDGSNTYAAGTSYTVTSDKTMTAQWECISPTINTQPSDASYTVGDTPSALSVSASLSSGTLAYLWKVSTNGGSTWSNASGTNNAATYAAANISTASAGTTKYKCIVTNSTASCSTESDVATITIAAPAAKTYHEWDGSTYQTSTEGGSTISKHPSNVCEDAAPVWGWYTAEHHSSSAPAHQYHKDDTWPAGETDLYAVYFFNSGTGAYYSTHPTVYNVTYSTTHATLDAGSSYTCTTDILDLSSAEYGSYVYAYYTPESGYTLDASCFTFTYTSGGATFTPSDIEYNSATGELWIDGVDGNITITATAKTCTILSTPTNFYANPDSVAGGNTYVRVTWKCASDITSHAQYLEFSYGLSGQSAIKTFNTLSKTATRFHQLRSNAEYFPSDGTYWVKIRALGDGATYCDGAYLEGSFTICTKDVSGVTPTVNAATSIGKYGATANWTAVSDADHYTVKVYRGSNASGTLEKTYSNVTGTSQVITGLSSHNTTYYIEVQAHDACGHDSNKGGVTFTTLNLTLYTVTFVNAAGEAPSAVTQVAENGTVSIPSTTACEGWTFAGWKIGGSQSSTTTDPTGSGYITSASWPKTDYTPTGNITVYAVFKQTSGGSTPVVDELTLTETGVSGTSYSDFSDVSLTSDAVYAGQCAGGNSSIQLRTKNSNSGVITTTSGGKCTKVTVTFNASNTTGKGVQVYGKTTAYSSASDLFNSSTYGTLLGNILDGTNTELTISGTYNYIGLRSYDGATYMDEIEFTWGGGGTTTWRSDPPCETPKVLTSIEITTPPDRLNYVTGEFFDETGAVVTAHYDDLSTATVTASWEPTLALTEGTGKTATASYTEGGVTKTATVTYNVYTPTLQKKDETGTTIDLVSPAISRTGATVTADATGNSYTFKEWQISGGTFSGETTTSTNPATITSVSGAVTVTAVYWKPITVKWYVSGNAPSNVYHTDNHARGWGLMFPTNPDPEDYSCDGKTFVGWTSTFPYNSDDTPPTLVSSGTPINSDQNYYAVFATETYAGVPPTWTKTAYGDIEAGTYLMCTADGHVFNGEINGNHRGQITAAAFASFAGNSTFNVAAPLGACELTFAAVTNGFTMYAAGKDYLYCSASDASHIGWHAEETEYWFYGTDYWRYNGAKNGSGFATAIVSYSNEDFRNYVSPVSGTAPVVFLKKTNAGVPATYSNYTTSCACEGYSFHMGSGTDDQVKATNTRICFEQDGIDNNMWKIENFAIPSTTKFFVGYQDEFLEGSSPYDYSKVVQWIDVPTKSNNKWQGQMFLVPNSGVDEIDYFAVGQATGAKGTLRVYNNSGDKNKYVNFEPDGYGITYGGTGYAFATTATANMRETEVVTLPNVGGTTYTVGLATATAGTYVTCAHSKAAENINAMGVTIKQDGKKRIQLVPGSFDADGAVYAIWDGTNSAWGDGTTKLMTDADGDGVWEGVVASTCVKINLVRMSSGTTASNIDWGRRWNQTGDIAVNDLLNKYTITSLNGNDCAYTTTAILPATGQKGKFRMWDNSKEQNWFVHFIPYYHLTYDGNGGGDPVTGVPASPADVCCEGNAAARTVAISSTEPTRSGYRFMGWATSTARAAAGTVDYKYGTANDDVELTKDLTLYAVWKQTYNVTYNYDGGSGSCSNGSYIQGESVSVCASNPTKAGCDFAGWSYSPSVTVTTGTFPMPASAVEITATWTDHTYVLSHTGSNFTNTENATTIKSGDTPLTLHYTCTGSYGFPNNVTITGGGKATWTKDTHYTWTVGGDKKSATLVINSTTISADVDIAITMATTYTVTYVHNDKGTFSGGSTTETVFSNDNVITLPTVTSVSCGLYDTFEGWIAAASEYSESTSKPATVYAGGGSYTVTGDVTLRALYSKCEGDGGSVYRKVTAIGDVTNGTYILVSNNATPYVYSGHSGSNTFGNCITGLTADGDDFTSTLPSGAIQVTIARGTGGNASKFTIYNGSKYLVAASESTGASDSESWWQLTDGSNVNSKACPAGVIQPASYTDNVLQKNNSYDRFRTYKNSQTGYVFLYKSVEKCTKSYATNPSCIKPTGVHIVYNANALDATMSCSTSNRTYKVQDAQNKYPTLASSYDFCTNATRDGYTLVGWNTQTNGLGTTYNIGEHYYSLPVSGDLDGENYVTLNVYAMWASAVSFNLGNATGGTGVPDVVEADGGFMLPTPTAEQLGTIPCEYTFYGWSETSVTPTTTKPTLYMPGTKYTGSYRTLYAVYRKGEAGSDPNLFSLSYTISATKYYVAAPSDITTAPSTWSYPYTTDKKFVASTNAEDAVAFGMKTNAEYTSYKQIYWLYDGNPEEKVYMQYSSGANVRFNSQEDTYNQKWTVTGTTELTFLHNSGGRYLSGTTTEIGCPSDVGVSTFTKEEASTTVYTYATSPTCYTTATLQFVTNGGTLNYPDEYTSSNYQDLAVPSTVYLPTATFPGEWEFEGWMKGSPVSSQTEVPTGANFYPVTLNTTTYTADAVGEVYFYAVYSKTVNDKQFDPDHEGTYKLFAILSDGTTKYYMPVWGGTQTTLDEVTNCVSTGDYTITPGTDEHAGQYKITHGSYTLGVRDDANTQFKNDANAWWNIEPSTSGKGTYRITIVGSSNRCMSYGGTGFFGNYTVNDVNRPSQPGYRDMEIGECIYTEYTSTPENIPYITVTGSPVKITSTNGERVYAPTKIHIEAHNFSTTRTIHFSATNGFATNPASVTCLANGSYSGDIDIYYQPSTDGDGSIISSVLTASQTAGPATEQVSQTFTAIQGRNMPADFVIAVKSGTQWYALPDDKTTSDVVKAVPIEVNDANAPTAALLVPHNVEWRLSDVVNSNSRPKDKVYFYEPNKMKDDGITPWNYALYAGSYPTIGTYGQLTGINGSNSHTYEWGLTTSDLCAYTISNANVGKNISINTQGNFGTHASNVVSETLYLLPITAYYEDAEFQVVEWKTNSVVVMYLGNAAKASVQVGDNPEGSNQTLSEVKVDHGVYELATAQALTSATFESLQIVFKNAGGTELHRNYVIIPAIVNGDVATSAYESVKDIAEVNDVVILKNGKLTSTGTGTDATSYKFANVTVYGGGKLDIVEGTKFGVTGKLLLRAGGVVDGAYDYVYPQLNLAGTLTNSSGNFYYEYITNYTQWFHLVLPFDARTTSVKYPTEYYGSAVLADNHGSWVIKRYDGATRATGNYNAWVDIESTGEPTPTTVHAGKGYIYWGAPKKVTANGVLDRQQWGIQRITMIKGADAAKTEEAGDKTISGLGSYSGVSGNSGKNNDQGWNLIGNPYMVNLTGLNSSSLQIGQLVHTDTDPWDGKWKWDNTDPEAGGLRYVTIPDDHFDSYTAQTMSWFTDKNPMKTGRTFFVQIAGANTSVVFASANRASLMPAWERRAEAEQKVDIETGIVLSDDDEMRDEVNFWIKNDKTEAYEYNADYPKTPNNTNFNIYGVHEVGQLSWVAISPEIAEGSMAIGYQVPAAGDYTLSLSETYVSDKIEALYVTDHEVTPEFTTNLMEDTYSFGVKQAESNDTRFTARIVLKDEAQVPTDVGNIDGMESEHPLKFLYRDKLYILRNGVLYDATGKKVSEINK